VACFSGGGEPTEWTASPAATATIAIAARYSILMVMVPPSAPRTNPTLSEMVPERASDLVCNRGVVLLTAASTRRASAAAIVIARISLARPGQKLPNLGANDPIFCAASSSMRGLGAPIASSCPNGNGRHDQQSGNESSSQDFRSARPSLAVNYTAHVADSQRFLLQGPLLSALAQIAKSGGLRFRSELPAVLASERAAGGVDANAGAFLPERGCVMRNRIDIDSKHSRAIVQEIGERLRAFLQEEPELPGSLRAQINRLRELEEQSPSIIRWDKLRC
jgi:hypothetical protein